MRPQTIVERLDFVAKRIPGLKFTPPTQLKPGDDPGYVCFMSCDMYYIEIKVDHSHQSIKDVVISHGNNAEGVSCPVLRKVLGDQDFETFAKHLTGLHSIYQINTHDKKVKQRAYPALSALETDLTILYDHQRRRVNNCHDLVHKSPIGVMEPRKGGLPVRLTYFITPYDLVDTTSKALVNLNLNNIIEKNLGLSATVEIEGSSPHKLQVKSLISNQLNSSLPAYAPFNSQNSEKLPAQFVLKLSQPFPMLNTSINQIINEITNEPATIKDYLTTVTMNSKESLVSLIARQELDLNKGPFCRSVDMLKGADSESCDLTKHVYSIKLLDQHHTYHILDNYLERQDGVYVTKIPFTHPTSIPNILRVLRQQAAFNFLIGSCIRRSKSNVGNNSDENYSNVPQESHIFDIIPVNLNNICISFEHPSKESLATLEVDFKEPSCQLYALDKESVCSNEYATKVLQKCWSIPITLRSVLKKCNERRLALLEDANKRRERELQELLTNNSAQQNLQFKPHLQDSLLQSKFNSSNEKSAPHDLNSIAEFLTSKVTNASTSDASNQTNTNADNASNRSNLLKKFSCKPRAKQNPATKNQTGNKILSLMLKRSNSTTSSVDDMNLKATLTKKAKTKNSMGESSIKTTTTIGPPTTKMISPDVAAAARLASKQAKQGVNNQNVSLSLIRSPNKSQQSTITSASNASITVGTSLTSQGSTSSLKQFDSTLLSSGNFRVKTQSNGNNIVGKPRKSSIGAVLDRLVGGVTPEQNSSTQSAPTNESLESNVKGSDSSKGSPLGKSKIRTPADQFAIKQGPVGGFKLTLTKTKPTTAPTSSTSSTSTSSSTSSSNSAAPLLSTSQTTNNTSTKIEANKILGMGTSTLNAKYTIPKISKSQQASQSGTNQANSTDNPNSNSNDSSSQVDDSSNPSSSANTTSATSTTTNKRTTSTPFNRTNSSNRNPVSSSTHPLGRTTSNPLANASRPTSSNENHVPNRISSSNQIQQNVRQINSRLINLQPQPQPPMMQRLVNNISAVQQQQQQQQQLPNPQTAPPPMFALGLPQQPSSFQNSNDLNIIAANQAALLSQQRIQALNPMQQLQPHQPQQQQPLQQPQQQQMPGLYMSSSVDANLISSSRPLFAANLSQTSSSAIPDQLQLVGGNQGVSSSSDSRAQDLGPSISTPSSPTECGHAEVVPPPPLIPIDSLDEPPSANSPGTDNPDDASDRLCIVDTNENVADSNSVAGTPKPSSVNSPVNVQDSNSATPSSSSRNADSVGAIYANNNGPAVSTDSTAPPICSQSPPASTTSENIASAPEPSPAPCDEAEGHSRGPTQSSSTNAIAQNGDAIAPQSTVAGTTSDMI